MSTKPLLSLMHCIVKCTIEQQRRIRFYFVHFLHSYEFWFDSHANTVVNDEQSEQMHQAIGSLIISIFRSMGRTFLTYSENKRVPTRNSTGQTKPRNSESPEQETTEAMSSIEAFVYTYQSLCTRTPTATMPGDPEDLARGSNLYQGEQPTAVASND